MAFLTKTAYVKGVPLTWTQTVLYVRVVKLVKNASLAFSQTIANVCPAGTVLAKSVTSARQEGVPSARRAGLSLTVNVSNVASSQDVSTISATKMAASSVKRDSIWTRANAYRALQRFQGAEIADQLICAQNAPLTS